MGPRWNRLLSEAAKFMAVGGVATLVAFLLFNYLVHGFWTRFGGFMSSQPIAAYVIANLIGMVISYRGTRSWALRHREPVHADGGRTAFLVINLATMLIPTTCLWFSRHVLGLTDPLSDNISANVIGATMGTVTRFYLYRTWVFRHPQTPGLPATLLERWNEEELAED